MSVSAIARRLAGAFGSGGGRRGREAPSDALIGGSGASGRRGWVGVELGLQRPGQPSIAAMRPRWLRAFEPLHRLCDPRAAIRKSCRTRELLLPAMWTARPRRFSGQRRSPPSAPSPPIDPRATRPYSHQRSSVRGSAPSPLSGATRATRAPPPPPLLSAPSRSAAGVGWARARRGRHLVADLLARRGSMSALVPGGRGTARSSATTLSRARVGGARPFEAERATPS